MSTDTEIDISNMTMREKVMHFRLMTFNWAPYLSPYIYSLVLVERPGIGTMAVDMQGRCYYDPKFVESLTLEQGGYVVLHEGWHLILRHCHRSKDIIGPDPTPRQRGRLNVAYDCVVWELMEAVKDHAPKIVGGDIVTFDNLKAMYPKLQRNMLPGQIYTLMLEQDEEEQRKAEKEQQEQAKQQQEEQAKQEDEEDEEAFDPDTDDDDEPEHGDDWTDWDEGRDSEDEEGDGKGGDDDGDAEEDTDESGEDSDGSGDTEDADGNAEGDGKGSSQDGEDREEDGPAPKFESLNPIDDGSCSDGLRRDYEEEPNDNWENFQEDQLLEQVEKAIEREESNHVPGRGNIPGCLKETIRNKLRPQPNPWDKLRAAVSMAAANPRGRPDHTYQRPNRRQFAMPGAPRLKGIRKYAPKAVVILDSSGSMTVQCKVKCLTVMAQGLKSVGDFPVICGDTRVQSDARVSSMKGQFEFKGGGGTDMVALIRYAEEKYSPDVIVLGTDGGTGWPSKPTRAQLIIALTQKEPTPPWATTVFIPDEGKVR